MSLKIICKRKYLKGKMKGSFKTVEFKNWQNISNKKEKHWSNKEITYLQK